MSEADLDDLRAELDDFTQPEKKSGRSARAERVIAGFEEIQRFAKQHGRAPQHGENKDIFERLYAVRLDRLRILPECRVILDPLDHQGLLAGMEIPPIATLDAMDEDELLAELGGGAGSSDITELRHVRANAEKRAAEEIANRQKCEDFEIFKPLFLTIQSDLDAGLRQTRRFERKSEIAQGRSYILNGQKAYVAGMEEPFTNDQGKIDARLRLIFDNGTESNMLMRSLQKALQQDQTGRRIIEPSAGPLFGDQEEDGDIASGTIYVLRSQSNHPFVVEHRTLIHKIGVTGGKVETRIANAAHDATYLLADVEIVATYRLAQINHTKLENLFHRIFAPSRIDMTISDRFGNPVQPKEWFLVPLQVIDEAVQKVRDGSIAGMTYDPKTASLVKGVRKGGIATGQPGAFILLPSGPC